MRPTNAHCEKIIIQKGKVLYLIGKPGMGKSATLRQIANNNEWQFLKIILSQIDSSEVLGIPRFITMDDGTEVMKYAIPEWAYMANQMPTLIFFDEINRASLEVRNACLQILLDKQIGYKFRFNDNVYLACAGNLGDEDDCDVEDFDTALKDRLASIRFEPTVKEWIDAFAKNNVNPYIIDFLKNKSEHFYKYDKESLNLATPRSWTFLSDIVGKSEKNIRKIMSVVSEFGIDHVGKSTQMLLRYLDEINQFNLTDVLNRYDEIENRMKDLPRDRISEFMQELEKRNLLKLTKKQFNNMIKFLDIIPADERVGFFRSILDNENYLAWDTNKEDDKSYNGDIKWEYLKNLVSKYEDEFDKIYPDDDEEDEENDEKDKKTKKKKS